LHDSTKQKEDAEMTITFRQKLTRCFQILFMGFICGPGMADTPVAPDDAPAHDYFVVSKSIPGFLNLLGRDGQIPFEVSSKVTPIIKSQRLSGSPAEIVNSLALQHNLDWFAFHGTFYVTTRGESMVRIIRLGDLGPDRARDVLEGAGIDLDRFPVELAAGGAAFTMSGPPKLLAIAEALLESTRVEITPQNTGIRIRRGTELAGGT
jgi:hypothetical protein